MKKFSLMFFLCAIAIGSFGLTAKAQPSVEAEQSGVVDLQDVEFQAITCRELLDAEGHVQTSMISLMYGYVSGKTGRNTMGLDTSISTAAQVLDACTDNPDQKLLTVFEANF